MKIAIQGHSTRGKEVIQILESLGGINDGLHEGNNPNCYYELHGNIIWCVSTKGINFKYYTLEEFEKEFPFKIGDKVQTTPYGEPAEVIKMYLNPACGIAYKVRYKSGVELQHCPENLKFYKEMKEERNITLTLDKAKEWYKKGGELKEIALQAFSEEELTKVDLPKTWKDFCKNYSIKAGECFINTNGEIAVTPLVLNIRTCKNWIPSKKSAEAHLAMIQLEQLRDCWRQGNIPQQFKYKINKIKNEYTVLYGKVNGFLSFCDRQTAEEFLKCFRDLIEKAGDLI